MDMFTFFEKLIKPFPQQEPEQPPTSLLAFCRYFSKGIEWHLLLMSLLSAMIALMEVSLFAFLGQLVDWLSSHDPATLLQDEADTLLWMSVMLLFVLPICVIAHSVVVHQTLLGNYPMTIRWQGHRYLLGQSLSFYQDEFAGRIATKLMQTSLSVREVAMKLLDIMIYVLVYFGGAVAVIAYSDYRLTAPLLIWFVIYLCVLRIFIPRLGAIAAKQADARSDMTGRIVDTYTNIATVKLFSHSRREADYAKEGMQSFLQTVYTQMRLATGLTISVWCINIVLVFSVTTLSIWLWMQSLVTAGVIAAAVALTLRLFGMSQWIMWETSVLFENIGTVQDGITTLSKAKEVVDVPSAQAIKVRAGKIKFDHVCFHYGKGSGVIDDVSMSIEPGEKVGFVGRSGAGKSTLVNLLLRFHDVEGGRILIDGQDISTITQESLRAQIGMVTQDTSLLHRSVRENIVYGRPLASEFDITAAAKQAKASEFIQDLQDSHGRTAYDAHVGERGVRLSGGQRQRIAIARVLLKDAPILILDEATSALDSEVEAAIQENLYKLMQGKTVIAIAHRLSTIAALDRLIILDKGRILEEGTHSQLIEKGDLYAQLWEHQTGGFLGERYD